MPRPDIEGLLAAFRRDLAQAEDPAAVDVVRRTHTGKKSAIKGALRQLRDLAPEDRPAAAKDINTAKERMLEELEAAKTTIEERALQARLDREWQDLTLPGVGFRRGERNPVTIVERRMLAMLRRLGFTRVDGPEVEDAYHNFDALNIPKEHPARDMQDTFWVTGGLLLRSHTSSVQIRVLEEHPPLPIRIASCGRVYRNEAIDATHLAMFHQIEGLWIAEGVKFSHLLGVLAFVARDLFGDHPIRFKPKFYPYTEPSVGLDLQCIQCHGAGCHACHGGGWITVLGAGMVHPNVLAEFGHDPDRVTGLAFGLGTTRFGAQYAGIARSRSLYETDLRVHRTVHRGVSK